MQRSTVIFSVVALALVLTLATASAQVFVDGYFRRDGTYVAPHWRSEPDGNPYNNWSTKGNVNPYTGDMGTRNVYPQPSYTPPPTWSTPIQPMQPMRPIQPMQPFGFRR